MADVITVSALNKYVKSILESDPVLFDIAIKGEISNFNMHSKTGHCYFSIKDTKASVKAVMFRSDAQNLSFMPENGMQVIIRGRISLYERDGAFQIYAEHIFLDGVGAAMLAFEQLKERLSKEGLFNEEAKQPIPYFAKKIGLVTSKTGAALQDILKVAARRCPLAEFVLAPVLVQGTAAPAEIAHAIKQLDKSGDVQLIIVTRGGGSTEDLWAFNAEEVARAAYACKTPLISAIGHEIDFTILDFVADMRAPTPSAAAEIALPDMAQQKMHMMNVFMNIANNMHSKLDSCYNIMYELKQRSLMYSPIESAEKKRNTLGKMQHEIMQAQKRQLAKAQTRMAAAASLAGALNPYNALARGYSVVTIGGKAINSVKNVKQGQTADVAMKDGSLSCEIKKINEEQAGFMHGS